MPNMDGWEVFNRIRGISLLTNVPIIFLTTVEGTSEEQRGFSMGAADYITKPFSRKELEERIKRVLARENK